MFVFYFLQITILKKKNPIFFNTKHFFFQEKNVVSDPIRLLHLPLFGLNPIS